MKGHKTSTLNYGVENSDRWYHDKYSRPLFIQSYIETKTAANLAYQLCFRIHMKPTRKLLKGVRRLVLDLYIRYRTSDGYGTLNVFTSNGERTAKGSRQYSKLGFTGSKLLEVLNALEKEGFVDVHAGFRFKSGKGFGTKIRATPKFIEHLEALGICIDGFGAQRRYPVVFTYRIGKEKYKTRIRRELAEPVGLRLLYRYNQLLRHWDIRVGGTPLLPFEKQVNRVFGDDQANTNGRIYGGVWQNLPSAARGHITVNGYRMVEIDIKSCHPTIAYALSGHDLTEIRQAEGDPYVIDGLDSQCPYTREIVKTCLLMLFNTERESLAISALQHHINSAVDSTTKQKEIHRVSTELKEKGFTLSDIVYRLKTKHKRIDSHLLSQSWRNLNLHESNIAMMVIEHFVKQDLPILVIHDSFLVQQQHQGELREVLIRSMSDALKVKFKYKGNLVEVKTTDDTYPASQARKALTNTRIQRDRYKMDKQKLLH